MSGKRFTVTVFVLIVFATVFGSVFYFVFAPGEKTSVSQMSQSSGPGVILSKTPSSSVPPKNTGSQVSSGTTTASAGKAVAPQPSRSTRTS